jgi:DNA-binding NtrC family response regulator
MAERDVLIVDDDRQVREVLHQIFVAAGYKCVLAKDGDEGLQVFKAGRPPLVVTDLKMPGIAGIELLRQARAVDGDVAVIVLTDAADWKNAIESLKLGAHAFLMKPINMDELLITVERALERRQLLIERREHQQAHGQRQEAPREVLIVEDDPVHRDLFNRMFLFAGYKCLLAKDGGEGLELFRRSRPPLILTEFKMPVMSGGERVAGAGIELLKQIGQEDPDSAVIVLGNPYGAADVKSGGWDQKTAIRSLKLGAYACLMKPTNVDELLITAERAIERRQLLIERRQREEGA